MGFFTDKAGQRSMKRLCGHIGWMAIIVGFEYCVFSHGEMPSVTEFLAGCCVALLGADTVKDTATGIASNLKNNTNGDNEGDTEGGNA